MDMVKTDQMLTYAARLGMECKDIKWILGQHENETEGEGSWIKI
jgi:hypothetical protein